jgi:hypothetical protein
LEELDLHGEERTQYVDRVEAADYDLRDDVESTPFD